MWNFRLSIEVITMQTFKSRLSKSEADWEILAFLKPVKKKNEIWEICRSECTRRAAPSIFESTNLL